MRDRVLVAPAGWIGGDAPSGPIAIRAIGRKIAWIGAPEKAPTGPERLELDGMVVPGVVDAHVHAELSDAAAMLRGGVTAVRDLGAARTTIFALARRSAAKDFDGPLIHAAGPILTSPGGYPTTADWAPPDFALELRDPGHAGAVVAALAGEGADVIKVAFAVARGTTLDDAVGAAVCRTAHAHGLAVTAHVEGPGESERALRAGVDELAHTPWTERLDDSLVEALAARVGIVSTLRIHSGPALDTALDNLRRFHAHGGRVRYGTDVPNPPIEPGIDAGELELLTEAGLSPRDTLAAATGGPLRFGARADLLCLDGDPLVSPAELGAVRQVVRAGRPLP